MKKSVAIALFCSLVLSCSSIDCPVENTVSVQYAVPDTLSDTLWVWTPRGVHSDTLLLNRGVGLTVFSLPISYQQPADTLVFYVADTLHNWTLDTIFLHKEDIPHFESVDCNAHFFHRLTGANSTHHGIDSVVINQPSVTYDQSQTHLYVYFKDRY